MYMKGFYMILKKNKLLLFSIFSLFVFVQNSQCTNPTFSQKLKSGASDTWDFTKTYKFSVLSVFFAAALMIPSNKTDALKKKFSNSLKNIYTKIETLANKYPRTKKILIALGIIGSAVIVDKIVKNHNTLTAEAKKANDEKNQVEEDLKNAQNKNEYLNSITEDQGVKEVLKKKAENLFAKKVENFTKLIDPMISKEKDSQFNISIDLFNKMLSSNENQNAINNFKELNEYEAQLILENNNDITPINKFILEHHKDLTKIQTNDKLLKAFAKAMQIK